MTFAAEKHLSLIDDTLARLLNRSSNGRGITLDDARPRVVKSLEKYLNEDASATEIRSFVDEIRVEDLCLILACEKGDETAWEDLVRDFDSTVRSAARKMTSSSDDAEDLASSIWAELYGLRQDRDGKKKSKLAYYSGRGSLGGWLRAVVAQLAIDEFRKQSRFVQVDEDREFENLANGADQDGSSLVSHTGNPEELFTDSRTGADVSQALTAAVAALEAEDRLIIKLYYFDDLKLKDIAAVFGYHEATASRRLARLQNDIRKSVEKNLKADHGWTDAEVKRHLSDTAAGLGLNLESLLAVLAVMTLMQDLWQ